jgi:hypothetical protein
MTMQVSRRWIAPAIAAVTLLTACGDARLDKLALGISKDSAASVIGSAPHRNLSYLTAGRTWDVQFYSRSDVAGTDSIPWRKMSPVIFISGKSVGWGWSWWGKTAKKQGIAMPQ